MGIAPLHDAISGKAKGPVIRQCDFACKRKWTINRRFHSKGGNRPPVRDEAEPEVINLVTRSIESFEELGGQLKSCRAAA